MGDYVLTQHLVYSVDRYESNLAEVAQKFARLVSDYCKKKDCLLIGNTPSFNGNTKVIIVENRHLEIVSFRQYDPPLQDQGVTIDLKIEVIPYNRIKKISKTYHKLRIGEEFRVFSAAIHLDNEEEIEIHPAKEPDTSSVDNYTFSSMNNVPLLEQLTTVIEQLESKI